MLYVISTPIGHLEDITARALTALRSSDAILCEDTRRASILLKRYEIEKPLLSYHAFKEKKALAPILRRLEEGQTLALISDAGTPCINDPGLILVQACIEKKIPFTALPGPCSVIQALVLSGLETERFQFLGFLPRKPEEALTHALYYPGTTIALESPERLIKTLEILVKLSPNRQLAVAREMTKTFEECVRGTSTTVLHHFQLHAPRGEIILLIGQGAPPEQETLELDDLIQMLQQLHGLSLKEAIQTAARLRGVPKKSIYREVHIKKE